MTQPQPKSNADQNTGGANGDCGSYCSTRDGAPSKNGDPKGTGGGKATGKPCAGCVGKADNKNPPGQYKDGSDHNAGYECDRNQGIGKTNPAHTGCTTSSTPECQPKPGQNPDCSTPGCEPKPGQNPDCSTPGCEPKPGQNPDCSTPEPVVTPTDTCGHAGLRGDADEHLWHAGLRGHPDEHLLPAGVRRVGHRDLRRGRRLHADRRGPV